MPRMGNVTDDVRRAREARLADSARLRMRWRVASSTQNLLNLQSAIAARAPASTLEQIITRWDASLEREGRAASSADTHQLSLAAIANGADRSIVDLLDKRLGIALEHEDAAELRRRIIQGHRPGRVPPPIATAPPPVGTPPPPPPVILAPPIATAPPIGDVPTPSTPAPTDAARSKVMRELLAVLLITSPAWLALLLLNLPTKTTR